MQQKIFDTFGWTDFPRPLFYNCSFGLRFELGGDHEMGPARFLQAMDRARAVADLAFSGMDKLTICINYTGKKRRSPAIKKEFKALSDMGFSGEFGPASHLAWADCHDPDWEAEGWLRYRHFCEIPNTPDQLAPLLWMAVAQEMPIEPRLFHIADNYILDLVRGVALHVYDDRGMDVVATDPDLLLPLYSKFNSWLLDSDRTEMDSLFSGNSFVVREGV